MQESRHLGKPVPDPWWQNGVAAGHRQPGGYISKNRTGEVPLMESLNQLQDRGFTTILFCKSCKCLTQIIAFEQRDADGCQAIACTAKVLIPV